MNDPAPRIVAPVCSVEEARQVIAAGADELYCGAMFPEWMDVFGDADLISRRQGRLAHVATPSELAGVVQLAHDFGRPVALTLNARYTGWQEQAALDVAAIWEDAGGRIVIVTDLGILLTLRETRPQLQLHLSSLAGTFNSTTAEFFAGLGVTRIILPRDLSITEIGALIESGPPLEYESLVFHQKCEFLDGMCGFYHGTHLPRGVPAAFDYHAIPGRPRPVVWSHDPDYEGHGCRLNWRTPCGPVRHVPGDQPATPRCGACALMRLWRVGVGLFKIAGRAYPTEMIVRATRFLKETVAWWSAGPEDPAVAHAIRRRYGETFGALCDERLCYYSPRDD